jgi:hypothetical protein
MTFLKKNITISLVILFGISLFGCYTKQDIEKDLHAPVVLKEYAKKRQQEELDNKNQKTQKRNSGNTVKKNDNNK